MQQGQQYQGNNGNVQQQRSNNVGSQNVNEWDQFFQQTSNTNSNIPNNNLRGGNNNQFNSGNNSQSGNNFNQNNLVNDQAASQLLRNNFQSQNSGASAAMIDQSMKQSLAQTLLGTPNPNSIIAQQNRLMQGGGGNQGQLYSLLFLVRLSLIFFFF